MGMRSFLIVLGSAVAIAPLGSAALGGCGGTIKVPGAGGGGETGGAGGGETVGTGGDGPLDAAPDYVDPGCPDAGAPETMFLCDPYHQGNGDCPAGDGCYIFSEPPQTICDPAVYGARCVPAGSGQQGTPCNRGNACGAGFTCVVSGSGNQCVQLCALSGDMACPPGLVCEPIDVMGFGGCL